MNAIAKTEVVVITGASAGVGRATARRFAQAGACIGLVARDPARLEATRAEVEQLGGRAICHAGDVAEPETHERIAELTENAFGAIDIWVNNAMTSVYSLIREMTPEEFRRVTEVTYLGVVYGSQTALRRMRAARSRRHRAGRLVARVSQHSLSIRLLRGQARRPRLHRLVALRITV